MSHATTEFEFHISPARSSSRPHTAAGTLSTLSRAQATELIESQGGRVTSGVSKATTAVIVGADAGSKLDKARALGITLMDEQELLRRVGAA